MLPNNILTGRCDFTDLWRRIHASDRSIFLHTVSHQPNQRNRRRENHQRRHHPAEQRQAGDLNFLHSPQKSNDGKDNNGEQKPAITARHGEKVGHAPSVTVTSDQ